MISKYKKDNKETYVLGFYPLIEALNCFPNKLKVVYFNEKARKNTAFQKVLDLCKENNIEFICSEKALNIASPKEDIYIFGVIEKYNNPIDLSKNSVVLDNPSNFGNLGTIMRTMLAFDFDNLAIINSSIDIFNPEVIRASMGAIFKIRCSFFKNIYEYLEKSKVNPYCFMLKAENYLNEEKFKEPYALIFGNEGSGLSEDYEKIGKRLKISQSDKVDSLNLAVSVAISLYHARINI